MLEGVDVASVVLSDTWCIFCRIGDSSYTRFGASNCLLHPSEFKSQQSMQWTCTKACFDAWPGRNMIDMPTISSWGTSILGIFPNEVSSQDGGQIFLGRFYYSKVFKHLLCRMVKMVWLKG